MILHPLVAIVATDSFTLSAGDTIGVVAVVIAFVVGSFHLRALHRAKGELETVRRHLLAALKLNEVLVENDELAASVRDLGQQFARATAQSDPLFHLLAKRDLDRLTRYVSMEAEGHLTLNADAFSQAERFASALLSTTKPGDEFVASSFVRGDFWRGATKYIEEQREKIDHGGVTIKRVFGFKTPAECDASEAHEHMRQQYDAKIKVKCLVDPSADHADFVVVLKPDKKARKNAPAKMRPVYAMVCRIGNDKSINHIDLWGASGLQSDMVEATWVELHDLYRKGVCFDPDGQKQTRHPSLEALFTALPTTPPQLQDRFLAQEEPQRQRITSRATTTTTHAESG